MMALLWRRQEITRNASAVDVAWTFGVGGLALLDAAVADGWAWRRAAIAVAMGAWSARLGFHLLLDRVIGKREDGRYADLRRAWGNRASIRFFWFYQSQAMAALFFSLPALIASLDGVRAFRLNEVAALALWTGAFAGEAAADRQLVVFKRDPSHRGALCQTGLWRYSRHPNYFFEWTMWVAYALFASASPWGAAAWACPLVMLYLLFRVTGIPATEAQALRTRGDLYRRYQQSTSVFVPWVPRS
jgi:steroid 5-alpha reductase family enzyme